MRMYMNSYLSTVKTITVEYVFEYSYNIYMFSNNNAVIILKLITRNVEKKIIN